jgi:6-phosphogluconolactonase (cycloisomerase 2 family)
MPRARTTLAAAAAIAVATALPLAGTSAAAATGSAGAVYVLSNQPAGNAVIVYDRGADGTLSAAGSYATGGAGTGGSLGSQNAVVVDEDASHLYAVDGGSSTVTSFRITDSGLQRIGSVPSGGTTPISVAVHGDRVYALNAGGAGNVATFAVDDGALTPLAGGTHALSGTGTGPAQVSVTPDGAQLVVTEKATSRVDVFDLDASGRPASLVPTPSAGAVPFGFDFDNKGHLLVSEAGASTASSYDVSSAGAAVISAAVPTTENAACWLVATNNGKFAYTGNAGGSLSISGFRVGTDGSLALLTPGGKTGVTPAGVSDLALSGNSHFLYARLGDGSVAGFAVEKDGALSALPVIGGLPAGAAGIAAV